MTKTSRTNPNLPPLAIVGMGCLFPKAEDLGEFWANIKNGVDAIVDVPETHWRPADYFDADPKAPDRVYAAKGGFLPTVDFNPMAYGIPPNALEATDTAQLLGLVAADAALRDAGYGPGREFDRDRVSVVLGVTGALELVIPLGARLGHPRWRKALREAGCDEAVIEDALQRIGESYVPWQENSFPGLLGNVVSGRIARHFDLGGTNCAVDAACASAFSAINLAQLEIATGRCDIVVTGGVDTFNDIFMYTCFCKTPALSPSGHARPFDEAADGTTLGEGIGMMVLKRLDDAERDGDRVYAVIRSMGTSSDGRGEAIYAPNPKGQVKALRRAYELADVTPDTIELIEAHGTGTKAGDAAELTALREVYDEYRKDGRTWCALGSVKSQIGHTKAAAGSAGLVKAAMALYQKVLPPTIKVTRPVQSVAPGQSAFFVNVEQRPWLPSVGHPRRAAVSAFGFGGSNYHCVLEEYQACKTGIDWDGCIQIVPFCGESIDTLKKTLAAFPVDGKWDTVRRAASRQRASFDAKKPYRLALAIERGVTDLKRLAGKAAGMLAERPNEPAWSLPDGAWFASGAAPGKLGVLFPGQGAQRPGMLRDLACTFPQMLDALADANEVFGESDGQRLSDLIYPQPVFDDAAVKLQHEAL
ncbi:MAG: hypothetical protein QG656_2183, partial [Candidatus Hydrogenedentes bacterium]|nr:hypothetical protein [Candidatus Hydrogenedentota bacterium]